jgi:hypothetical protein
MDDAFCIIRGKTQDNNAEIVFEDYQELLTFLKESKVDLSVK